MVVTVRHDPFLRTEQGRLKYGSEDMNSYLGLEVYRASLL